MSDITVALGGGGMKGLAHIGVLEQLKVEGFNVKAIAGTSAGGLVGALYASGVNEADIITALAAFEDKNFFSRQHDDGPSLLGLSGLIDVLKPLIGEKTFEDLNFPFAVTSVDLNSHQEIIINTGGLLDAVLATIAIPGVFPPQKIGDLQLVDGGILDPVPVAVVRWLAPKYPVVAVCLHPAPEMWSTLPEMRPPADFQTRVPLQFIERMRISQALMIYIKSMDIQTRMTGELRMKIEKPEVLIRPRVSEVGILDRVNPEEIINRGREVVLEALPKINQSLTWYHQVTRQFQSTSVPGKLFDSVD